MTAAIAQGVLLVAGILGAAGPPVQSPAVPSDVASAIDKLGSFDLAERTAAVRTLHRAPADVTTPALERAARSNRDEYVRFRALVILAGVGGGSTDGAMRDLLADKNDRVRMAAYQWFERHPASDVTPRLLSALPAEQSEFLRPALVRALVASSSAPAVREALRPLVLRGVDFFRGELIAALGDYKSRFATAEIVEVAKLDGPLREDAVTALGEIGDPSATPVLLALRKSADREAQPTIAAALCLLDIECPAQKVFIEQTLTFAAATDGYETLLRGAVHALGALAVHGHNDALDALIEAGVSARDAARGPIALGLGLVALRSPAVAIQAIERRKDTEPAMDLLADAFDMLSEDFAEELFYSEIRGVYWDAPVDSPRRAMAARLIEKLEF